MNLKKIFIISIIFFSLSTINGNAFFLKNKNQLHSNDYIKNYLYGSILHNENQHNLAAKNLNKTIKLNGKHIEYDIKYISSLVVDGRLDEAAKLIFDTDKIYSNVFLFELIKSFYFIKHKKYNSALIQLKKVKSNDPLFLEFKNTLIFWLEIENYNKDKIDKIKNFRSRYLSIGLINKFLSSNYINNSQLYNSYNNKVLNSDGLIRYQIFSAWNEKRLSNDKKAFEILENAISKNDKNLLLKQTIIDFKKNNNQFLSFFNPKNFNDNIAEVLYLFSNLYQQREDVDFSNMLLSLSLELNDRFVSNYLIFFENKILENKKDNFNYLLLSKLKNIGSEFSWYINYQISIHNKKQSVKFLENSINKNDLFIKNKFFDLANFYRIKKDYRRSLEYYKKIENLNADLDWTFYYFKGICYERLELWDMSDKNLKKSISLSPKEYSVINYLAYSWLERKVNIDQATKMLEDAVKLSRWELGYIIDSLGWAYFLQKDFDKAERLLKIAYEKTPSESEVYDHYGDVLWVQKKFLQARYVWHNALSLESINPEREKSIKYKIINGLKN